MTTDRNKLLELAKEAGFVFHDESSHLWRTGAAITVSYYPQQFERFAALLQAHGEPVGTVAVTPSYSTFVQWHPVMPPSGTKLYTTPPSSDQVWNEAIEAAAKRFEGMHPSDGNAVAWILRNEFKRPSQPAAAPVSEQSYTGSLADIAVERNRQMSVEGWKPEHDDEHDDSSLLMAAICYAMPPEKRGEPKPQQVIIGQMCTPYAVPIWWPDSWCATWWKPKDRRRDLVRAAALIAAEIDRMDRTAPSNQSQGGVKK